MRVDGTGRPGDGGQPGMPQEAKRPGLTMDAAATMTFPDRGWVPTDYLSRAIRNKLVDMRERDLPGGGNPADFTRGDMLAEAFNRIPADAPDEVRQNALRELFGRIGEQVIVKRGLTVEFGHNIEVGDHVLINYGVTLLDLGPIVIGDHTKIAPGVQLLTATHSLDPDTRKREPGPAAPIIIGENVWLGGGATVCPGVIVGDGAVVGAGAVVTRDVPEYAVAAGNPARFTKWAGGPIDALRPIPGAR